MQIKAIYKHIIQWMRHYAHLAKSEGFVIGISGGIDSAVTSTLAAKSKLPVLCIEMPIYQSKEQVNRGEEHIFWLKKKYPNVQSIKIELTDIFNNFINLTKTNNQNEKHTRALVNTRARFRMTTLYYFAQLNNFLVTGTGNKVEDFGVGFYTKYGDGGVDISPIADLMKSEVFKLGKELGIAQSILNAPPTDGLWDDNRTDEDQIGATYAELEWAMTFQENEKNLTTRQREVLKIYHSFHQTNQHKMNPIPVCKIPDELKSHN